MDLHVTLASAPPSGFPSREIVVDTTRLPTGAALAERLEAAGYQGPFSIDDTPLETATAHAGALTDGAIIVCGPRPAPADPSRLPHLLFVVHSGPDSGQVIPLTRGAHTIGRAASDIVIADPGLSRRHALLTVTGDAIVLEDLGSANGTFVDGERIDTTEVTVSADLRFGTSRCRIELLDDDGWRHVFPAEVLKALPVGPDPPKRPSRLLILTALLPLVLGVALVLTTGMWFFLAFSALSAVTGVVPLLTYRRDARVFGEAVRDAAGRDRVRRRASVPDPGQTALDVLRARRDAAAGPAAGTPPPAILLRLGTADQPANLRVERDDGSFAPPVLPDLPLVLPWLSDPGPSSVGNTSGRTFTITGDTSRVLGLLRAMLLQAAHPNQGSIPVVCWGPARNLPIHARFLPNVRLTQDPLVLARILEQTDALLVLHVSGELPEAARRRTVLIVRFMVEQTSSAGTAVPDDGMTIAADGARARIDGREYRVVPDGVSASSFERTARLLGRVAGAHPAPRAARPDAGGRTGGTLPSSASLWSEHVGPGTLATSIPGRWAAADPGRPTAFVGLSTTGALSMDLVRDGPHLLVAGTTGSGKSEFLRTLVLGLALDQPPGHLTVLLVDYKGGSGLGALASLPHCVGCLTDLTPESTARALTSLRAELRRREQLCADHGARDLDELRIASPSSCPPRLVVVIDEFRILSDDVPSAVPDLMKVAALGRSLGIHLILATQRPQGAVTPDLRANITSSVLLRVQTTMESHDILGSGVAADIPVDAPGRAFLRRGTEPPLALQVASSSGNPTTGGSPGWQDVAAYLGEGAGNSGGQRYAVDEEAAPPAQNLLEQAVAGVVTAHEAAGGPGSGTARRAEAPRFRPVLPALPARIPAAACAAFHPADAGIDDRPVPSSGPGVPLGVADFPERQAQRLLCWRPSTHSHLALIGLPGSGAAEALTAVASSLPACDPDGHLYVLDGDGTLGQCSTRPQVGAYVPSHESKRACRVLERLAALPGTTRGGTVSIVLVVTGWGRWSSQFRDGRLARAEEALHAIVRDGGHSGVAVLVAGDRELTASRFFALVPNRVYLPLGAHQETTLTWPRLPQIDAVPGRGLAQGRITGDWGDGTCQLLSDPVAGAQLVRPPARSPFPVYPLPHEVSLKDVLPSDTSSAPEGLLLGVQGDDLHPFTVTLHPGEVYLVLGHPGSGRTNALRVLRASGRLHPGRPILAPPAGPAASAASAYWRALGERSAERGPADGCILLVDDADRLPADVHQVLSGLVARGAAAVLSATPGPALMVRVPLAVQARTAGRGIVLGPRTAGDGDLFGVRLDPDGAPVAGRGYACEAGAVLEVQVARASDDPA